MEKALGTRLIVCCLEVLPLRPFTFFVSNAFPDFGLVGQSVSRSVEKKKPKKKMEKKSRTRRSSK